MSVSNRTSANASRRPVQAESRGTQGFTMFELMAVVAIVVIMAAIAFGSIVQTQKALQQRELDDTAREIFIAAQNHLSLADELGYTQKLSQKGDVFRNAAGQDQQGIYLYAIGTNASKTLLTSSSSLLSQMLPTGSIDENIRLNGTYVIRYDADSATVLDVFFAWKQNSSLFSASYDDFAFASGSYDGDYKALFHDPDYRGPAKAENRQNYNNRGIFIGYYGGSDAESLVQGTLNTPTVKMVNEDRLYAEVTYTRSAGSTGATFQDSLKPEMDLVITGMQSKKTKTMKIFTSDPTTGMISPNSTNVWGDPEKVTGSSDKYTLKVLLDDITKADSEGSTGNAGNKHFAYLFRTADGETEGANGAGFLPGEDITVQASVHTKEVLARTKRSNTVTANSLFASASKDATTNKLVARIDNVRHLENLSGADSSSDTNNVSSFNPHDNGWGKQWAESNGSPVAVRQVSDISWSEFCKSISEGDVQASSGGSIAPAAVSDNAWNYLISTVRVSGINPDTGQVSESAVKQGSFVPVIPKFNLSYNGGSHRITDMVVNLESGSAGVFGDLALSNGEVKDLSIVNAKVNTGSGSAGALAGTVTVSGTQSNPTISNVTVFNDLGKIKEVTGASDDSAYEMKGSASVGGLVGSMTGGSISQSAAAVYVNANATGATANTNSAGGLVGSAYGVRIAQSYSGGHTFEGKHLTTPPSATPESTTNSSVVGHLNVYALGNAGGLVGTASATTGSNPASTSIDQCYSTASVFSTSTAAGGIVGSLSNGSSIANSYTVGLVQAGTDVPKGVLAGTHVLQNGSAETNAYVGVGNQYSELATGLALSGLPSAESNMEAYIKIAGTLRLGRPYDATLATLYKNEFPYMTMSELAELSAKTDESKPAHLYSHFGDWPQIETLVINEKTEGSQG